MKRVITTSQRRKQFIDSKESNILLELLPYTPFVSKKSCGSPSYPEHGSRLKTRVSGWQQTNHWWGNSLWKRNTLSKRSARACLPAFTGIRKCALLRRKIYEIESLFWSIRKHNKWKIKSLFVLIETAGNLYLFTRNQRCIYPYKPVRIDFTTLHNEWMVLRLP